MSRARKVCLGQPRICFPCSTSRGLCQFKHQVSSNDKPNKPLNASRLTAAAAVAEETARLEAGGDDVVGLAPDAPKYRPGDGGPGGEVAAVVCEGARATVEPVRQPARWHWMVGGGGDSGGWRQWVAAVGAVRLNETEPASRSAPGRERCRFRVNGETAWSLQNSWKLPPPTVIWLHSYLPLGMPGTMARGDAGRGGAADRGKILTKSPPASPPPLVPPCDGTQPLNLANLHT